MKKKQTYKEYLQKSFIQYAMVLFFTMAFLLVLFFMVHFYLTVVRQNTQSNIQTVSYFQDKYDSYEKECDVLVKNKDIFSTLDGDLSARTELSRSLYSFANQEDIKAIFVLLDRNGEVVLSNLTSGNTINFSSSPFVVRTISRLQNKPETTLAQICDVELTQEQNCFYSFAKEIVNEKNECEGYLFLNMKTSNMDEYADNLNDEILIVDRFNNAIFSSIKLEKDPGDKFPARRVNLEIERNGIYTIEKEKMYTRLYSIENPEIRIYTLTSIERNIQMLRMAGSFFMLMLVAVGILIILMTRLYTRLNERGMRDLMRDLEVKNLEEQFNPHFVFNVMESVRFQIDEDPHKAQDMLLAFSTLMRYSINYGQSKVRLETDIDYLSDFLMLQKIRYNNLLTYEFQIPDELLDCMIPKLLLQPIIENSIRHGFIKGKELHIQIIAEEKDNELIFTIKDNGKGITEEKLKEIRARFEEEVSDETIKHVGLYNVEKVLSMLYGEQYGLTINSHIDEGTIVILRMPYEVEDEDV
ncbi:MAG: histidine kinase [Solobacterium sp.]|nr:histidine kinase [Solobacterium sp.]